MLGTAQVLFLFRNFNNLDVLVAKITGLMTHTLVNTQWQMHDLESLRWRLRGQYWQVSEQLMPAYE